MTKEAVMGIYGEQVLPRIINVACGLKTVEPLRRRVCEGLEGDVVEIGFGSGLNVPFYPDRVARVAAVEPADVGWKLAGKRLRATSVRTLHFVEHGLAPDERVRRWQRRLEPIQKRAFGGCHLTRPIVQLLTSAGFTITELDVFYEDGAPKIMGADSLGTALSP